MSEIKKQRNYSFDALRFVSISAVIMIHVSSRLFDFFTLPGFITGNIFNSLSRFAVPVFMMITGALLLNEKRDINYKNTFTKYIGKTLCLFALWSAVYALVFQMVIPLKNGNPPLFTDIATAFFKGHYHMWYLYSLMGFYLVMPLFKKLTAKENEKKVRNIIIFLVIVQSLIPIADLALKSFSDFSLTAFYNNSGLRILFGFHFYFLLGWYLTSKEIAKRTRYLLYLSGGISLVLTIALTHLISVKKGYAFTSLYDNLYLNTVLFSAAVFVFFTSTFKNKESIHPLILNVSKLSFGIYIIHPVVLEMFCEKEFMPENPVLYVVTLWIITAVISYLLCLAASKIPIVKKLIRT